MHTLLIEKIVREYADWQDKKIAQFNNNKKHCFIQNIITGGTSCITHFIKICIAVSFEIKLINLMNLSKCFYEILC